MALEWEFSRLSTTVQREAQFCRIVSTLPCVVAIRIRRSEIAPVSARIGTLNPLLDPETNDPEQDHDQSTGKGKQLFHI